MDVTLWSLDFLDKVILPPSSEAVGYISMNAKIELCGSGSCELVFNSKEVMDFARAHPEGFLIFWGKFQGYITDWQFKKGGNRLFGSHLNSLLYKAVFPLQDIKSGDVLTNIKNLIEDNIPWLEVATASEKFPSIGYKTETYLNADKFTQEYLQKAELGYSIYSENKKFIFKLIKPQNNTLVLSENNLNVYEVQEDFSNKNVAYRVWYKKTEDDDGTKLEEPKWTLMQKAETPKGIFGQDVVLSASSKQAAKDELAKYKIEHNIECKTRNISYLDDYKMGDIIRYQSKDITIKKIVSSVELWYEGSSYHEEPQLTDYKEE